MNTHTDVRGCHRKVVQEQMWRWEEDTAASLLIMEVGTGTIAGPPYGL
jgi:hypothetical protein